MLNKIILVGRLGKDATVRGSADKPIVAFSIAVSTPLAGGERDTQWFDCAAFGSTAKFLAGALPKKAQLVLVEGKMKKNKYTDSKGIERESMDVVIDNFQFLERKSDAPAAIGGGATWDTPPQGDAPAWGGAPPQSGAPAWDDRAASRDPRDLWK